jgi:integrase
MTDLIAAYVRHMEDSRRYAERTIAERQVVLRRADRQLPFGLVEANTEELQDWLSTGRVKHRWSAQTTATYQGHFKGFFGWGCAGRDPILADDPTTGLIRPKVPKTLPNPCTDEQVAIARDRSRVFWKRAVALAAYAGARCCEIAALNRDDITEGHIILRGKGAKTRVVPNRPEVWDLVRDLPAGPITRTARLPRASADYISTQGFKHMKAIGLPGVTMHRFRHWYATTLLANGANIRVVQELMGHESPETTAIYTLITSEQRRIAVAALPTLDPASS